MEQDISSREVRYFWTGWFDGHSLTLLATTFILLSLADLVATLRLMTMGVIHEGNALANAVWGLHGPVGFVAYKTVLVALIIALIGLLHQRNARLARTIIWGGILLMSVIALRHLAIIAALAA